jgi:hypothetical protein
LIKQLVEFLNNNFKMLVRLVVVCMLVSCLGCRNDMSKSGYHSTLPICDRRFFVETFTIMGGGAFGGDRESVYLTDSLNFRKYLGTYVNTEEYISIVCRGDSIYIYRTRENKHTHKNDIENTRIYSVQDLRKSNAFE